MFQGADDGSVVVVAKNYRARPRVHRRFEYESLPHLVRGLANQTQSEVIPKRVEVREKPNQIPLKEIISISIGAVTGDAKYFLMNEAKRLELGLPFEAMQPVLSKSHHVYGDAMTLQSWKKLRDANERIWLFRPDRSTLNRTAVKSYLNLTSENGGCMRDGYKISRRPTWYLTPLPDSPHGFLTGMAQHGPAICLNRMRNLSSTNTLYTVNFRSAITIAERTRWAMMLLTSSVREQLQYFARNYALGLSKIEPGDFSKIWLPVPKQSVSSSKSYKAAVQALVEGRTQKSAVLADSWIA